MENKKQTKKRPSKPAKKLARRKKKPSGIEGLFIAIIEVAMAGLHLYKKVKPIVSKKKSTKKKGKQNGNKTTRV